VTMTLGVPCILQHLKVEFWWFPTFWAFQQIPTLLIDGETSLLMKLSKGEPCSICEYCTIVVRTIFNILSQPSNSPNLSECCRYCARLIHGWGGTMGALNPTEKELNLLKQMERYSMTEVRLSINRLIERGYDKLKPIGFDEQVARTCFEASARVIELVKQQIQPQLETNSQLLKQTRSVIKVLIQEFKSSLAPFLVAINSKTSKRGGDLDRQFEGLFKSIGQNSLQNVHNDEDAYGDIDSDEESRLYDEVDQMTEANERLSAFAGPPERFMANSFQKAFLNITQFGAAYDLVCTISTPQIPVQFAPTMMLFRTTFSACRPDYL
jgi:hypothetical protein